MTYRIIWEIDLDADTPRAAAEQALEIMQDTSSTATVFAVTGADNAREVIDLSVPAPRQASPSLRCRSCGDLDDPECEEEFNQGYCPDCWARRERLKTRKDNQ